MLYPSTYRDQNKNLIQTGNIGVTVFGGSNTKPGDLGCVSMSLHGKIKRYKCRRIENGDILHRSFVAVDAKQAIAEFDKFHEYTKSIRRNWTVII
jgi:hypothetical protein